jgi:hypothetical protein
MIKVKVKLFLCLATMLWRCTGEVEVHHIGPYIFNFSTRQRWLVICTLHLFYLQGKSPQYPFVRLGGMDHRPSPEAGDKRK